MVFLKNIFRYILFLIALVVVISLIFGGLALLSLKLMPWFFDLSRFWQFVAIIFLGGLIWKILQFVIGTVMYFVTKIPSNKRVGYYTVMVIAGLNAIFMIYRSWTHPNEYLNQDIIMTAILNVIVLVLTFTIIGSSLKAWEEEETL